MYNNFHSNNCKESKVRGKNTDNLYSTVQNLLNLRTPVEKQWHMT